MNGKDNQKGSSSINEYEDIVIPTTGVHGGDISSQRVDGLDKRVLRDVLNRDEGLSALDIGCGLGAQGMRLSLLGADVTLIDIMDLRDRIELLNQLFDIGELEYLQKDVRDLQPSDLCTEFDIVYSQRFIHYLKYENAVELVDLLAGHVRPNGRIYISASGLNTELGDGYPDRDKPLEQRYNKLSPEVGEKHGILEPVCLYEKEDLKRLLTGAGFEVKWISTSGFGNIKAIAEK